MLDFIERLRQKPEHIRRKIATGTAITLTGLVALGWVGALVAGNAFILQPTSDGPTLAQSGSELSGAVKEAPFKFSDLMGAVGASGSSEDQSSLIIVESESSSTINEPKPVEERTVIPF